MKAQKGSALRLSVHQRTHFINNYLIKILPFFSFSRSYSIVFGAVYKTFCYKVNYTLVQALRLCTGRTAHRGSRDNSSTLS
jgi:hypothetical protein